MDPAMLSLKEELATVERAAEQLLLAKRKLVEYDRHRNGNREALTALRKLARKPSSEGQRLVTEVPPASEVTRQPCRVCGVIPLTTPAWIAFPGGDSFVRSPFHTVHSVIEREQEQTEMAINGARSEMKDKTLLLSESGALADKVGPSLVKAFVTLKDSSGAAARRDL